MLLERIEIDGLGANGRIQLGPFSHRLNAVHAVGGAETTAIQQFVRDLMLGQARRRDAASDQRDWNAGRLIWANTGGLLYCRREADGTPHGRLTIDFEPRDQRFSASRDAYRRQLAHMPAAVVDWIITTANETSLTAAVLAISDARLDTEQLPSTPTDSHELERLQARLARLDQLLLENRSAVEPMAMLHSRQRFLQSELIRLERETRHAEPPEKLETTRQTLRQRESDLRAESEMLRNQETDLRASLADLQTKLRTLREHPNAMNPRFVVAEIHRRRLQDLDGQLIRWRETLREVRALRQRLSPVSRQADRLLREGSASSEEPTSLQQLEVRLDSAHRQIDWLADRYAIDTYGTETIPTSDNDQGTASAPRRDHDYVGQLRGVKSELYRLYDSMTASSPAGTVSMHDREFDQLKRCEIELLGSMEQLIFHRQSMLRQIAAEHQVPVEQMTAAFGDWYQCQDHPHLYDWLLSSGCPTPVEPPSAHRLHIAGLEKQFAACESELDRTVNRLENCLSELGSVRAEMEKLPNLSPRSFDGHERQQVLAELDEIRRRIEQITESERLTAERADCVSRIAKLRCQGTAEASIHHRASCWLARLSGGRIQRIEWDLDAVRHRVAHAQPAAEHTFGIRLDGRSRSEFSILDHQMATLAVRMAAADELARRGQGIPLLIETHSLFQTTWLDAVIQFADSGQQTIMLTSDRDVVERVERHGGTIHSFDGQQRSTPRTLYAFRSRPSIESAQRPLDPLNKLNRDLDTAWRETYGLHEGPESFQVLQDEKICEVDLGYSSDRPVTRLYDDITTTNRLAPRSPREATFSPFFLTVDSPVEQAPSVDAVAAARLRTAGVTRVGQLLSADAADLASVLGLADVTDAAIRRWQREADLVCRVPQLRGFDARVLVGCGITDPKHLAAMHPGLLLEKVEAFLATDRGRRILRSGSSYELSRITSWIAAANRSVARSQRHGQRGASNPTPGQVADRRDEGHETTADRCDRRDSRSSPVAADISSAEDATASVRSEAAEWRFHLDRNSALVDAPTIGPRTAAKLEQIGFYTVNDLLQADADEIAETLDNRRIDGDRIRQWQQQAALVCRVPMLRGHDAQLLVAAGINEPERLAECDPEALLDLIAPVIESNEGKRILRGAAQPDLEEVAQWIEYAQHHRMLAAA
ncbi:MAG: DUF4332 domain-containing protein [Pirellulaceae bacterium]